MTLLQVILLSAAVPCVALVAIVAREIRRRNMHLWLGSYLIQSIRRWLSGDPRPSGPIHVLICIADHFEPAWGGASDATADSRVDAWIRDYPRVLGQFRDSDGRPPRHTFFYPIDQYEPRHVDALAGLCRAGFGEVEIHLHHDHDTAENLERTLRQYAKVFSERHGLLGRWANPQECGGGTNERIAFGFVHGNWALDNSRPDGRWCGVQNEIDVLERTGCFGDFTLPSAPDVTQTRKINSIYYAVGSPHQCKSHDRGTDVGAAPSPSQGLMLIQGPLGLWWPKGSRRPRIENGCIQAGQPPTMERLDQWLRAGVRVASRPDWLFVKLHTHGAAEANQEMLLGPVGAQFHRSLAERTAQDKCFNFHYVTAREMYNLARAAEAGWKGSIASALDFAVIPPRPNTAVP